MKVTLLLADAAEAVNGKLYILGGGWSMTGPGPTPMAIALKIEVPWDLTNTTHEWVLRLRDADGQPVFVNTPDGEVPVQIAGQFELGRPPGITPGTPMDLPLALNVGPLPLVPGQRYTWELDIDGRSQPEWYVGFTVRPASPA